MKLFFLKQGSPPDRHRAIPVCAELSLDPAGLLLNSMAAANQEISPELQALAMKDSRFSKGQTRSKGGAAKPPGGGKRRVRLALSLQACRGKGDFDTIPKFMTSVLVQATVLVSGSCMNNILLC